MACGGCKKRRKKFKEAVMEAKEVERKLKTSEEKAIEHFMRVCEHGVPNGYTCKTCKKVIEIPRDAKIKPEGYVEEVEKVEEV